MSLRAKQNTNNGQRKRITFPAGQGAVVIPYELTIRPTITDEMRDVLDLADKGLSERRTAQVLKIPRATVHQLKNQGEARRYGLGKELGELNNNCHNMTMATNDQPEQWNPPPVATITPRDIDQLHQKTYKMI